MPDSDSSEGDQSVDKCELILNELKKFQKFCKQKFEENKVTNEKILFSLSNLNKEIVDLKKENSKLKEVVNDQQNRIEFLEKQVLESTINIQGVPYSKDEVVQDVVYNLFCKADVKLTTSSISKVYRKKPNANGKPGIIIVKLNSNNIHDVIIEKVKRLKLDTLTLGFKGNASRIYVNHEMSVKEKSIFFEARKLQESQAWKYVWEKKGLTFIRHKVDSEAICIRTLEQLRELSGKTIKK